MNTTIFLKRTTALVVLVCLLAFKATKLCAQTPKAIWCEDNTTLYFTYDDATYAAGDTYAGQTITTVWTGTDVIPTNPTATPSWRAATLLPVLTNVVFDASFAAVRPTTLYKYFSDCSKLTDIAGIEYLNTSEVTNMSYMFSGCSGLTSLDVTHFDTDNVTDMSYMFYNCKGLTSLDVTHFNTGNVTNMSYMFYYCNSLTNLDVTHFNTGNVTNMSYMFYYCKGLTSLDVTNFDTSNVTTMASMFSYCNSLTNLDVTHFNTGNVTTLASMFSGCSGLTSLDVTNFNTSAVTTMASMFSSCSGLTSLNLTHFDTDNVTDMSYMFYNCSGLTSLNVTNFDTDNVTDMSYMFYNCSGLTSLDVTNFNTSNVLTMQRMFYKCSGLTSLDVTNFNTGKVMNMSEMFSYINMIDFDLTSFNTSNVTTMKNMFYGSKLTAIDIRTWNMGKVKDTMAMFWQCGQLQTILRDDAMTASSTSNNMFGEASKLIGEYGKRYERTDVSVYYGNSDKNGYLTKTTEVLSPNAYNGAYYTTYYNEYVGSMADENTTVYKAVLNKESNLLELSEIEDKIINPGQAVILKSANSTITLTRKLSTLKGGTGDFENNALGGIDYRIKLSTGSYRYGETQNLSNVPACQNATVYTMGVLDYDEDGDLDLGFFKFSGTTLKARRAFFVFPNGNEAGYRFDFDFDDTPTGISEVQGAKRNAQDDVYYNLAGQRVVNPTKGVYVVNGKKVIIK